MGGGQNGNVFIHKNVFLRGIRVYLKGRNNVVTLGGEQLSVLRNLKISVYGSNNRIIVEGGVFAKDLNIYCANEGCLVHIKENTEITGRTELAVMEGTKIQLGRDCLFSSNITLRAGDSHSVIDLETGRRINPSKDIIVSDHVWVGNTVIVTKGAIIGSNCVIGTGSVVTGKVFPDNCAIAGNPARIVKEEIEWCHKKI